jgi:hypothetical protein
MTSSESRPASAGMSRPLECLVAAVALSLGVIFVTWPHATRFASHVVSDIDPGFSMWRLAWFAHATRQGENLLHANIFHPEPYTYLLSDATFLQAALAAPALWSGVPLAAVYNALLALGMVASGVALYWLATGWGISRWGAAVAATIFALAPYRIEHINHLELQWAAPAVVVFGSLYQVLYAPRWRSGVVLGLALWLQFLASVYYAVYLLPILLVLIAVSFACRLPDVRKTCYVGLLGAVLCAALTLPIARLYLIQAERVGKRSVEDTVTYSATPWSYLASPQTNVLYGSTHSWLGAQEKRSFPGAVALALGMAGLFSRRRRVMVGALVVTVLSLDLSFGVHSVIYSALLDWWPVLGGLRAPARYGIFVLAGVATLAALGCERIAARRSPRAAAVVGILALAIAGMEYRSPQHHLWPVDLDPPVYRFLRQLPDGVVVELPVPARAGLAELDLDYMFWSTKHWHKLVNGYSGYYPPSYPATLERLNSLPDPTAIAWLRERNVRYIIVHKHFLENGEGSPLLTGLAAHPQLRALGSYADWTGGTVVFELTQ